MPLPNNLRNIAGSSVVADTHYRWLSPPGASALGVLFVTGRTDGLFGGRLSGLSAVPRRFWLVDARGEVLDEAVGCRHKGGVLLTLHGGPGVRRAIDRVLRESARQADDSATPLFGANRFERTTLGLLPSARGAGAVTLILEASGQARALDDALSRGELADVLERTLACRFLYNPPRVQLWGPVNAGKSSLLNALCGRTLAAAGDEPGLTRDVIEGRLEHAGFELRLFDAPGTWVGSRLDDEALKLAHHWRAQADLTIELTPPGGSPPTGDWWYHSRADESGLGGISIRQPDTLTALKQRLVRHFFGTLTGVPPQRRFALHPELRNDLRAVVDGKADRGEVRSKWLG